MRKRLVAATIIGTITCLALSASAQTYRRGERPMATLYEGYNFQGRSVDIYASEGNLDGLRFNDKARSAKFQGQWRVCEDAGYGGRCQDVRGDVADLNRIGMAERISSLQTYAAGGAPGGDYGYGGRPTTGGASNWDSARARPAEGAKSVFFPYPDFNGRDIAAGGMSANAFCRSKGLGAALYYDSSERAAQAVDGEGRYVANTTILRDILCRRY